MPAGLEEHRTPVEAEEERDDQASNGTLESAAPDALDPRRSHLRRSPPLCRSPFTARGQSNAAHTGSHGQWPSSRNTVTSHCRECAFVGNAAVQCRLPTGSFIASCTVSRCRSDDPPCRELPAHLLVGVGRRNLDATKRERGSMNLNQTIGLSAIAIGIVTSLSVARVDSPGPAGPGPDGRLAQGEPGGEPERLRQDHGSRPRPSASRARRSHASSSGLLRRRRKADEGADGAPQPQAKPRQGRGRRGGGRVKEESSRTRRTT